MKQFLVVNSAKAYAAKASGSISSANDLSELQPGALALFKLSDNAIISAPPTEDFGIAAGKPNNSPVFMIPEVNFETLSIVRTPYSAGATFTATMVVPTVAAGSDYTIVLTKNGTAPHERNTWTATERAVTGNTASDIAAKLRGYFTAMANTGSIDVVVSGSGANVVITAKNVGEAWTIKGADALSSVSPTSVTLAAPVIGDKTYVEQLSSTCAAGKGFTDTDVSGRDVYPNYPTPVENKHYTIYTLRFQVGRKAAKTRDEKVWQVVHIAVPEDATSYSAIEAIFNPSTNSNSGSGSGTGS